MDFNYTPRLQLLLKATRDLAVTYHNEFFTPEHFLLACLQDGVFDGIVASKNIEPLCAKLIDLFENGDDRSNEAPEPSFLWRKLESSVALHARGSQVQTLDVTHYIVDKEVGTRIDVKDYKMREPWYVTIAKTGNEKFFGSTIISVFIL